MVLNVILYVLHWACLVMVVVALCSFNDAIRTQDFDLMFLSVTDSIDSDVQPTMRCSISISLHMLHYLETDQTMACHIDVDAHSECYLGQKIF